VGVVGNVPKRGDHRACARVYERTSQAYHSIAGDLATSRTTSTQENEVGVQLHAVDLLCGEMAVFRGQIRGGPQGKEGIERRIVADDPVRGEMDHANGAQFAANVNFGGCSSVQDG